MYVNPSIQDFKDYFIRDFPYGTEMDVVVDGDIFKAIQDAEVNANVALFNSQSAYTNGFLNLTAHFLVMSLRASSQGISGQYPWMQTGKGVGNVNESLQIPDRIMENPFFAMLSKTNYGAKYLMMILPKISGQMFSVYGRTNA